MSSDKVNVTIYLSSGQTIGPIVMSVDDAIKLSDQIAGQGDDARKGPLVYPCNDGGKFTVDVANITCLVREQIS